LSILQLAYLKTPALQDGNADTAPWNKNDFYKAQIFAKFPQKCIPDLRENFLRKYTRITKISAKMLTFGGEFNLNEFKWQKYDKILS
jgi:hypothetical protein